jgi:hypothetical protein
MRSLVRIVAPVLAVSALLLGGGSSALAASDNAATTYSRDLDAAWCFDDVVQQYCFDVSGQAHFVQKGDRESVVTNERFHTVVLKDGVQVGESTQVSMDRFAVSADGTYVQQTVQHVRSVTGDETCSIQIVWRQADFETVVDHWSGGCA